MKFNWDLMISIKEINNIEDEFLNKALPLMSRTQGEGLFSNTYLERKIKDENSLVLGGFIGDELVSVGCAEIIQEFEYYIPFDEKISDRLQSEKVGSLCTLCVHEDFQRKGIGQKVTKKRLDWLKGKKCSTVLGISWQSGLGNTSDRVFQKFDFHLVQEVEKFFKEGAVKHPFDCPGCRTQPCVCSAVLFELKL